MEPEAGHPQADPSQLPSELADECGDWPVYLLHRQAPDRGTRAVEEDMGGEQVEAPFAAGELDMFYQMHRNSIGK